MPVWKTTSVEETPELHLASWKIFEVSSEFWTEKTRHFVGYNLTEREGRVSSSIVEFDKSTMRGRTKSGRVYQLVGESGHNGDGMYTWTTWCDINKITDVQEVDLENA